MSLLVFGFNEFAAAIPTVLGALLTFGAVLLFAGNSPKAIRNLWVAGMLGASLSAMVSCTTPNAQPLAIGFFSLALAVLLPRKDRKSALIAGGLFALAIASHLSMLYCTGIALLAVPIVGANRWRNTLLAIVAMLTVFAMADTLVYALWTGEPFYRFRIVTATHMTNLARDPNARKLWNEGGGLSTMFFVRPVRDLILSKSFVLLLGLAVAGAVLRWRRLSPQSRALLLVLCLLAELRQPKPCRIQALSRHHAILGRAHPAGGCSCGEHALPAKPDGVADYHIHIPGCRESRGPFPEWPLGSVR